MFLAIFPHAQVQLQDGGHAQVNIDFGYDSHQKFKQIPPPPKFKLWLLVWLLVFITSVGTDEAGMLPALLDSGWLHYDVALFFSLFIKVAFIM